MSIMKQISFSRQMFAIKSNFQCWLVKGCIVSSFFARFSKKLLTAFYLMKSILNVQENDLELNGILRYQEDFSFNFWHFPRLFLNWTGLGGTHGSHHPCFLFQKRFQNQEQDCRSNTYNHDKTRNAPKQFLNPRAFPVRLGQTWGAGS